MYVGNEKFNYQSLAFDIDLFDLYLYMCSLRDMFPYVMHLYGATSGTGTRPVHQYIGVCRCCMNPIYVLLHVVHGHLFMARNKLFLITKYLVYIS